MRKTLQTLCLLVCLLLLCLSIGGCAQQQRSVTAARINTDGELIVIYSDGSRDNLGVVVGKDGKNGKDGKDGQQAGVVLPDSSVQEGSVAAGVAKGLRSAVSVLCTYKTNLLWQPLENYSAGSGVIYHLNQETGSAYILTNHHVVYAEQANTPDHICEDIKVYLYGGELTDSGIKATYVGGSAEYDIAVLYIENSIYLKNTDAQAVTLGDMEPAAAGATAIAIGNPEGNGTSVTVGVVSVDSEYITLDAMDVYDSISYRVMRVDTPVNSGNSGGGLFDSHGNLIGIVNAKTIDRDVENIGYAIPVAIAAAVADNIIDHCVGTDCRSVMRADLGITLRSASSESVYDSETGRTRIREVVSVMYSPSESLGAQLLIDDILVSATLNGRTVILDREFKLADLMLTARAGDTLEVTVSRRGMEMTIPIPIPEDSMLPC